MTEHPRRQNLTTDAENHESFVNTVKIEIKTVKMFSNDAFLIFSVRSEFFVVIGVFSCTALDSYV